MTERVPSSRARRAGLIVFCAVAVTSIFAYAVWTPPSLQGDWSEYCLTAEAWANHGSPDIRPADVTGLLELLAREGLESPQDPYKQTIHSNSGRIYSFHFWLYPLIVVPAKLVLRLLGGNEMAAFQATNAAAFMTAAGFVLFFGSAPIRRRWALLLLASTGPLLWHLRWPHPEVFIWSLVIVAVVLLEEKRLPAAALVAATAATHYQPLLLLALLPSALLALERDWKRGLRAAACIVPAALPIVWNLIQFGTVNPLLAGSVTSFSLISAHRTVSFFVDLNQGMLPYVPGVLFATICAAVRILLIRSARGTALLFVLLGMILLVQPTTNWNSGTVGMIRYAIWMLPLFALVTVDYAPRGKVFFGLILLLLFVQLGIVVSSSSDQDYLRQRAPARLALNHLPRLYHPEPEIFAERQLHGEGRWHKKLPVGYVNGDGWLTKILVSEPEIDRITRFFGLDGSEAQRRIRRFTHPQTGELAYIHPVRGHHQVVEPLGWGREALQQGIEIRWLEIPPLVTSPSITLVVKVTNISTHRFWGPGSGASHPLTLGWDLTAQDRTIVSGREPLPFLLDPGETVRQKIKILLPRQTGSYVLELDCLLERLAWRKQPIRLQVDVTQANALDFRAQLASNVVEPF